MIWYDFQREVNQELWWYVLGALTYDYGFENEVFSIYEFTDQEYEFFHKSSGVKIRWYKYPMRAAEINMPLTHEQFLDVLYDCRNSISSGKHIITEWWR